MNIDGKPYRTIWLNQDGHTVEIIDQTKLPHVFETATLGTLENAAKAISTMQVRGAPLIGAAAAYGVWLALRSDASDENLERAYGALLASRPTAINLKWALDQMLAAVRNRPRAERAGVALRRAGELIAVRAPGASDWRYPAWQFENGRPRAGVARVVSAARAAGVEDGRLYEVMTTPLGLGRGDRRRLSDLLLEDRVDEVVAALRAAA